MPHDFFCKGSKKLDHLSKNDVEMVFNNMHYFSFLGKLQQNWSFVVDGVDKTFFLLLKKIGGSPR
jgi:hypothetical protein